MKIEKSRTNTRTYFAKLNRAEIDAALANVVAGAPA